MMGCFQFPEEGESETPPPHANQALDDWRLSAVFIICRRLLRILHR
jgi:hypothetical protein